MMEKTAGNFAKVFIFGLVFSLLPGLLAASLYVTFVSGYDPSKLETFDFLAFWYETPFVLGFVTDRFKTGLLIFAASAVITVILFFVAAFPKVLKSYGSAKWADAPLLSRKGYLKNYKNIIGPIFGKATKPKASGKYITNGPHPHSLVSAPTRAGKGVGIVIPTLLRFDGSVVALDVKGELFDLTSSARRQKGDKVYRFAPKDREGCTHRFNPLDRIAALPEHLHYSEARRLADNLINLEDKNIQGFLISARDIFAAAVVCVIEKGSPTIAAVHDLLYQDGDKQHLFSELAKNTESEEARKVFNNMAGSPQDTLGSFTSILDSGGLGIWTDPLVRAATAATDFPIDTLRSRPATIYLCVSPNELNTLAPLMRLFFQEVVTVMQDNLPGKDDDFEVLFLMDEFKSLGRLELIETAITTIAGFGGRFMIIVQNLANLTDVYGREGKENFLGNTGIQVFMATTDAETPEYLSRSIGDYTRKVRTKSWSTKELAGSNVQEREEGARLIRPEDIRVLSDDDEIILIKGEPPARVKKVRYYEDRILAKIFKAQDKEVKFPNPIELLPKLAPVIPVGPKPKKQPKKAAKSENATSDQSIPNILDDAVSLMDNPPEDISRSDLPVTEDKKKREMKTQKSSNQKTIANLEAIKGKFKQSI